MKRIFIDSDVIRKDEVETSEFFIERILGIDDFQFDQTVDFAWHKGDEAWEAVKAADEIYANTSLIPLSGYGSYTGSVVVMDVMMKKAIEEKITGKSIYFMRPYNNIDWRGIDLKLMPKAFKKNKLFTMEDRKTFVELDIQALVKRYK